MIIGPQREEVTWQASSITHCTASAIGTGEEGAERGENPHSKKKEYASGKTRGEGAVKAMHEGQGKSRSHLVEKKNLVLIHPPQLQVENVSDERKEE